jgi:Cof subfamily protein (haloacid dehalogenase superfamily)
MNYDMLFLDVDGTLKQEPYPISDKNKMAILTACKAGKKISIASGRNKYLILKTVRELKLDEFGASYTVALNGAHILENQTGKTLHVVPFPIALTRLLYEKAYELQATCHVYTENYAYFNYMDQQYTWYQNEGCTCYLVDLDKADLGFREEPLKFIVCSKEPLLLEQFKKDMNSITKGILNAEFSTAYSLEYTSVHASKGLGMEYVCRLYGQPASKAIAAGDGENDISMLKMSGLGIAMKNALASVKEIADTVTDCTCRENGVTEIIHKYLLEGDR